MTNLSLLYLEIGHHSILQCEACGLGITNPLPSAEELKRIYLETYNYKLHQRISHEKAFRAKNLLRLMRPYLKNNDHILEIGCMNGEFLSLLKSTSYAAEGIETSGESVQNCLAKNLAVRQLSIEELLGQKKLIAQFDVIVMSHTLEHIRDLPAVLNGLRTVLKPGGRVILAVPNLTSLSRRIFGRHWGYWCVPIHLYHFRTDTISRLLANHGFQTLKVTSRGGDSLMLLSTIRSWVGARIRSSNLRQYHLFLADVASYLFRYWYVIGNEDLIAVFQKDLPGTAPRRQDFFAPEARA